jgi:lipopolysaccharide biosynthesis regulator YciM
MPSAPLLEIYQVGKEMAECIEIARELPDVATHKEIAEYYCELAAGEIMLSRHDTARQYHRGGDPENRKCRARQHPARRPDCPGGQGGGSDRRLAGDRTAGSRSLSLVAQRLLDAYRKLSLPTPGWALLARLSRTYPSIACSKSCTSWCWKTRATRRPIAWCAPNCSATRRWLAWSD